MIATANRAARAASRTKSPADYLPELAEIRARAAAIRDGWSQGERQKRELEAKLRWRRLLGALAADAA
jgi:hypothetical protein